MAEEKVTEECEISVTLCDNEEIAVLNDQYMGRQGPTDVLSFPLLDFIKEGEIDEESKDYDGDYLLLGDIVISIPRAKEQAEEFGHSLKREVGFLTVHSMLHLLGYDHMEDDERERMQEKERTILKAINLPRE